ncbi:hypothetical protein THAOC_06591 [Thalassiosira oceanica]|uniref:Uncharacterized protein n=1 Tax=Thalassiosira oceanica TaxID=159749 RepID=K0T2C3_THAOC|nr:hypothetical protein THAOC_06591 [Thalassiosira oceanica]|eukprot:EJK71925.1 hypothetical protein THAOC_06591 [Thalassiosira oceanica]
MRRIIFPGQDVVECYEIIAASIRRNHVLKRLNWIENRIPSDEQADLLIESIIDNRSIRNIELENCFNHDGVNGCRALAALIASGRSFQELDFSENGLCGMDDAAAALATNPQLERLLIRDNQLNDRDAELIAEALKQNTNLQNVFLDDNSITSAGFERIRAAIYDPSSMNNMESCNHTCWVDLVKGNAHGTPRQRRNRKLYQLLYTRHLDGSNVRHLNAELGEEKYTIKLVPKQVETMHHAPTQNPGVWPASGSYIEVSSILSMAYSDARGLHSWLEAAEARGVERLTSRRLERDPGSHEEDVDADAVPDPPCEVLRHARPRARHQETKDLYVM